MAKINKQNPLKYFNDAADARKKSVIEGNKKLVKAQIGIAALPPKLENTGVGIYQGPLDETASSYLDKAYPSTSGPGVMPTNKGGKLGRNWGTASNKPIGAGTYEMLKRADTENVYRSSNVSTKEDEGLRKMHYPVPIKANKIGGQTKSKKKK